MMVAMLGGGPIAYGYVGHPRLLDGNPHTDVVFCAFFNLVSINGYRAKANRRPARWTPASQAMYKWPCECDQATNEVCLSFGRTRFTNPRCTHSYAAVLPCGCYVADLLRLAVGLPALDCAFVSLFLIRRCRRCCHVVDHNRTQLLLLSHGTPFPCCWLDGQMA
jgi:hypothetical protein